jgi:predicted transcriptional regulator
LARIVDRDIKLVHEDIVILAELGLLERTESALIDSTMSA